jgi:hypothetical protein
VAEWREMVFYFLITIFICLSFSTSEAKSETKLEKKNQKDTKRNWVAMPRVSFGTMDAMKVDIPKYKSDSVEHKILQLALDIENVFPYDAQYKETYLSSIPKKLHDNTEKRNSDYMKIAAAKKAGSIFENSETGLLEASSKASTDELTSMNQENINRANLYALMGSALRLRKSDKAKVAKIYAEAIKYQKYYVLSGEPDFSEKEDSGIFTSTASIYDSKLVWTELEKVIKDEEFLSLKDSDEKDGIMDLAYKCGDDDASFRIRICAIKNSKLGSCKNAPKDKSLYSYVDKGTLIWVEAEKKSKQLTLIVPEYTTGEFQDIRYCKNESRTFDLIDKLSARLISKEKEASVKKENIKIDKSKNVKKK